MFHGSEEQKILEEIQTIIASIQVDLASMIASCNRIINRPPCFQPHKTVPIGVNEPSLSMAVIQNVHDEQLEIAPVAASQPEVEQDLASVPAPNTKSDKKGYSSATVQSSVCLILADNEGTSSQKTVNPTVYTASSAFANISPTCIDELKSPSKRENQCLSELGYIYFLQATLLRCNGIGRGPHVMVKINHKPVVTIYSLLILDGRPPPALIFHWKYNLPSLTQYLLKQPWTGNQAALSSNEVSRMCVTVARLFALSRPCLELQNNIPKVKLQIVFSSCLNLVDSVLVMAGNYVGIFGKCLDGIITVHRAIVGVSIRVICMIHNSYVKGSYAEIRLHQRNYETHLPQTRGDQQNGVSCCNSTLSLWYFNTMTPWVFYSERGPRKGGTSSLSMSTFAQECRSASITSLAEIGILYNVIAFLIFGLVLVYAAKDEFVARLDVPIAWELYVANRNCKVLTEICSCSDCSKSIGMVLVSSSFSCLHSMNFSHLGIAVHIHSFKCSMSLRLLKSLTATVVDLLGFLLVVFKGGTALPKVLIRCQRLVVISGNRLVQSKASTPTAFDSGGGVFLVLCLVMKNGVYKLMVLVDDAPLGKSLYDRDSSIYYGQLYQILADPITSISIMSCLNVYGVLVFLHKLVKQSSIMKSELIIDAINCESSHTIFSGYSGSNIETFWNMFLLGSNTKRFWGIVGSADSVNCVDILIRKGRVRGTLHCIPAEFPPNNDPMIFVLDTSGSAHQLSWYGTVRKISTLPVSPFGVVSTKYPCSTSATLGRHLGLWKCSLVPTCSLSCKVSGQLEGGTVFLLAPSSSDNIGSRILVVTSAPPSKKTLSASSLRHTSAVPSRPTRYANSIVLHALTPILYNQGVSLLVGEETSQDCKFCFDLGIVVVVLPTTSILGCYYGISHCQLYDLSCIGLVCSEWWHMVTFSRQIFNNILMVLHHVWVEVVPITSITQFIPYGSSHKYILVRGTIHFVDQGSTRYYYFCQLSLLVMAQAYLG